MPTSRDINAHRNINAIPLQTPTNILHLMSRALHQIRCKTVKMPRYGKLCGDKTIFSNISLEHRGFIKRLKSRAYGALRRYCEGAVLYSIN